MAGIRAGAGHRAILTLFGVGAAGGMGDRELLDAFLRGDGESSELAFGALVERHGPMVFGVCRRMLRDRQGAEDAFQATFLILARRAPTVRVEGSLGRWLHGVSRRVAARARRAALRESPGTGRAIEPSVGPDDRLELDEALAALDEEVARLPRRYRSALILCHLQGRTHDRAAEELGCPVGTVRSRLARARDLLRARLTRRGLAPGLVALGAWLDAGPATAAVPRGWVEITTTMAVGRGLAPVASTALCESLLRSLAMSKMIKIGLTGLAIAAAGAGASAMVRGQGPPGIADAPKSAPAPAQAQVKEAQVHPKSLKERFDELTAEQSAKRNAWMRANQAAKTDAEHIEAARKHPRPMTEEYARKFLALVDEDPKGPVALDALYRAFQSVGHPGTLINGNEEAYRKRHVQIALTDEILDRFLPFAADPRMASYCQQIGLNGSLHTEALLREVLARNPDRAARGLACQGLGNLLGAYAENMPAPSDPEKSKGIEDHMGRPFVDGLRKRDPVAMAREAEMLHERVLAEFADAKLFPGSPGDSQRLAKASESWLANRRSLVVGKPAPAIVGKDLDGKPLTLADYRGQVVALVFWGSWCGPCMRDIPAERELAERLRGRPFALLGVNTDYTPEAARKAILDEKITWPNWYDGDSREGKIVDDYHILSFPTVFVLDAQGIIRARDVRGKALDEAVESLVKEQ